MVEKGRELAHNAVQVAKVAKPQHLMVEVAPCGLPLDTSSKNSLIENRDQYARAAQFFEAETFDAFFLNGFTRLEDVKCALMGMRKVYDGPIFASVTVNAEGGLTSGRGTWGEVVALMAEYGASVAGFESTADVTHVVQLLKEAQEVQAMQGTDLCLMTSFNVFDIDQAQQGPTPENPYYVADTMLPAAICVREAGCQFLRATGAATPAYTATLAAATSGLDVLV
jgi:5-methyltetrahydrofolate--homocysteine methyltransferase